MYLAHQESLDRMVAVKVLRHDIEDPAAWRAFQREARAIAKLSGHPHVVTVYDAGRSTAGGHPYLVTEFLDRGSLHDIVASEGALPPLRVAEIGAGISNALHAAHGLGIHHRDVKPGNVLLGSDGRVKLGDFGIARLLSGRSVTTTDLFAFTPEHVAPEVLRHEPDGPWSDVYGLASTLATALLGAAPIRQTEGERVDAYLARKMMAPAPRLPESVPRSLAEPIERALDPSPHRRPTVPEFARAMATSAALLRDPSRQSAAAGPPLDPEAAARTSVAPERGLAHAPDRTHASDRSRPWLLLLSIIVAAWMVVVVGVVLLTADGRGNDGQTGGTTPATTQAAATTPALTAFVPVPAVTTPTTATTGVPTTAATTSPATTTQSTVESATVPSTSVAPVSPTEPDSTISADAAADFIDTYYDEVNAGDYTSSWGRLTPEFQNGKAVSYAYYVDFWDDNDIEIRDVQLIASDATEATVHVDLRWNDRGPWITDEFLLRRAETGELLIAAQTAVGR